MDFEALFYPALLVCGFFTVMAIVSAYAGLWVMNYRFRKCPHCNQSGTGHIAEQKMIDSVSYMDFKKKPPARVTVKTFEDHYECEQCSYQWIRTAKETSREARPSRKQR